MKLKAIFLNQKKSNLTSKTKVKKNWKNIKKKYQDDLFICKVISRLFLKNANKKIFLKNYPMFNLKYYDNLKTVENYTMYIW